MLSIANFVPNLFHSLEYTFAIVTLLGGVIAIHEFGHFIFAKWCGIRVDTFSIGFGPRLFARKYGETEYCFSLIPLGGFVKIYGQDPEEVKNDTDPKPDRSFSHKRLHEKLSVLFGGPLFNYFLAIFIFSLLAFVGTFKLPPQATRVITDSPAYQAGIRSGDVFQTVAGAKVSTFEDVLDVVAKNPEKEVPIELSRGGQTVKLNVKVQKEHALTPYGEEAVAGVLEGLEPIGREPIIYSTLENHPWGFKNEDRIMAIDDVEIRSWEDLERAADVKLQAGNGKIRFKVKRGKDDINLESSDLAPIISNLKRKDSVELLSRGALYSPELFILDVAKDSPAAKAGLQNWDRIITANGNRVQSFDHLRSIVQGTGETLDKAARLAGKKEASYDGSVKLSVERKGKLVEINSGLRATKGKDPLGATIVTYTIGILSANKPLMPANLILERTLNPFVALWRGTMETADQSVMTVVGIKKLAMGEVSAKSVGGPIMIGKLAGDTFSSRGWRDFLRIMAIISISLGVFNLLPVPILDGGHIVFACIESARGKPLSQAVQNAFLKVGLSLILLLMVFALYNDLSRVLPLPF